MFTWLKVFFRPFLREIIELLRDGVRESRYTNQLLQELIDLHTPPVPVRLRVTLTEGNLLSSSQSRFQSLQGDRTMSDQKDLSKAKAPLGALGIDFQLHDNGNATATITPEDEVHLDTVLPAGTTVPAWVVSDPTALQLQVSADGLTCLVTPADPPKLAQDVTLTVSATLPNGNVISGTSDNIDVVAGEAVAFRIAIQ